jgi:hypothetical protein
MTLLDKIIQLYPELTNYDFAKGAIRLENASNGNGDYIAKWDHPTLTRPTNEQLSELE